ncbi:MAG TPA: hypothetical protein VJ719_14775 [Chthoniobacterales bacterium]|nr:hypothetical protein [Chthoniobacterales bacterium]
MAFVASPQTLVGETPESGVTTKMDHPRLRAKSAIHSEPAGPAAPAQVRLANISTRLAVGSGGSVLIAGFIITGSEPKRILLRALGPLLPVKENLADPTLELHNSSGLVAANDNWRDTQEDELQATTIPPGSDYESAIVKVLNPGAYTAVLSGKGQTTGVGLVEVYDLDLLLDSRLANISTRGFVDQGDNVLIAGTIVFGGTPANVLFRALGPSLPGVPNALQDTTLELFDGQGSAVASNDNWRDSQAAEIKATTIPPSDPREAAILRQLTPGAYTAIVRGKNNSTGVALVEAYHFN